MLSQETLHRYDAQTILHRKKIMCSVVWEAPNNIAQVKTQCNIVLEAQDNNAQEKILFDVVLILLRQHCTGQNLMKCCWRVSRQHYIRKNPVQCSLKSKPYAMLFKRLQTTLHRKNPVQHCLNTLGAILHKSKHYSMLSEQHLLSNWYMYVYIYIYI